MERRLKHAGYDVATYASAEHLLDCLPSDSVLGCILLDVRIPGLSGPELQERLSELGSTLPIRPTPAGVRRTRPGFAKFDFHKAVVRTQRIPTYSLTSRFLPL